MANKWVSLSTEERGALITLANSAGLGKLAKKLEKANNKIKVSSARGKGMGFQRDVCGFISKLIGIPFLRGDDESLIAPRPSGQNGVDIILRGEAKKRFPFSVECKAQETLNLVDTIEQAKANVAPGTDWLVLHRKKALSEDIVMMAWDTFANLVSIKGVK